MRRVISRHVTILGGGPSLTKTANLEPPFIGVNMSALHWPCDHVVWVDRSWWTKWAEDIPQGTQQWTIRKHYPAHVNYLDVLVKNSGAAAIHLAMQLGYTTIYLAGFDFGPVGGQTNWHTHYNRRAESPLWYRDQWYLDFLNIQTLANERGIEIINLNPDSKLTLFPYLKSI
jgi:hypothetical protein